MVLKKLQEEFLTCGVSEEPEVNVKAVEGSVQPAPLH
jgi:hypothetical protein